MTMMVTPKFSLRRGVLVNRHSEPFAWSLSFPLRNMPLQSNSSVRPRWTSYHPESTTKTLLLSMISPSGTSREKAEAPDAGGIEFGKADRAVLQTCTPIDGQAIGASMRFRRLEDRLSDAQVVHSKLTGGRPAPKHRSPKTPAGNAGGVDVVLVTRVTVRHSV